MASILNACTYCQCYTIECSYLQSWTNLKQLALVEFGWGSAGIELLFTVIVNVSARLLDHQALRLCYCGDYVTLFPGYHCKYRGAGWAWEISSWKTSGRKVNTWGYVVPNEKSLVRSVQVLEVDSINWETVMMSSEFLTQCYGNQILIVGRSKADGCAFKVWKKSEVLSTCRSYRPQKDTESVRSTCA